MSETANATVVKKDVRKNAKKTRLFPVMLRGWSSLVANAYGPAPGSRSWLISEQPVVELGKVNDDMTMYKLKKPISFVLLGTIVKEDEEQGKVHIECQAAHVALAKLIEDYIFKEAAEFVNGGKSEENFGTRLSPFYGDNMISLKSKYFTGRYTKIFHNSDLTTTVPAHESMVLEIIVQIYGIYAMEDKSAWGPLVSIKAFNCVTDK